MAEDTPPHDRPQLALHLAISQLQLSDHLRSAVEEAATRNADSMKALHLAVREFTVALREEGIAPEQVLIALKTMVNNRSLIVIAPHLSDWRGDDLREKMSTWCIEEFFREKTA